MFRKGWILDRLDEPDARGVWAGVVKFNHLSHHVLEGVGSEEVSVDLWVANLHIIFLLSFDPILYFYYNRIFNFI